MKLRANTNDGKVFQSVVEFNEYGLPDSFHPEDVIVDVGAHIGSFTYACLIRGAGHVYAYEPHPDNFQFLRKNTREYQTRVNIYELAVMDTAGEVLKLKTCEGNTGGHVVGREGEQDVITAAARGVIERACQKAKNGRVRLLKLDCEGAEWVILWALSPSDFDSIDEIVGEIHPHPDRDREDLYSYLGGQGFEIRTWKETSDGLIVFRAYRPNIVDLLNEGMNRAADMIEEKGIEIEPDGATIEETPETLRVMIPKKGKSTNPLACE
jgi:FkbM family methyltransferase